MILLKLRHRKLPSTLSSEGSYRDPEGVGLHCGSMALRYVDGYLFMTFFLVLLARASHRQVEGSCS